MSHMKDLRQRNNLDVITHHDVLVVELAGLKIGGVHELEVPVHRLQDEVTELGVERVVPKFHRAADFRPCLFSIFKCCFSIDVNDS